MGQTTLTNSDMGIPDYFPRTKIRKSKGIIYFLKGLCHIFKKTLYYNIATDVPYISIYYKACHGFLEMYNEY